jgi:hypothetical protein
LDINVVKVQRQKIGLNTETFEKLIFSQQLKLNISLLITSPE